MDLFDFQDEDITAIEDEPSALIIWDMGLGKTLGALERDRRIRMNLEIDEFAKSPSTLIVAPLQTHDNWKRHIHIVFPTPRVFVASEDRGHFLLQLQTGVPGFYILHWELLRQPTNSKPKLGIATCRHCGKEIFATIAGVPWLHTATRQGFCEERTTTADPRGRSNWAGDELNPALMKAKFLHVIADEAHRAKNRKAQQTKVLKQIGKSPRPPGFYGYRTALTGTPIANMPPDLWSILNWLRPKDWTSFWAFWNKYTVYTTMQRGTAQYREYVGPKNSADLRMRIGGYTVQRKKADVLTELPDRYYSTIRVDLAPKQRRAYDAMRRDMVAWIGADEQTPLVASVAIAKLMRLQQFAIAHATLAQGGSVELSEPSSKLDAVMQLLEDNPNEQFVIFSNFKGSISLLAARLSDAGITSSIFTGDIGSDERRVGLDQFTNGESRVFLATIGAGGEGLDGLQRASTVIFIDRAWSPAQNDQAESRLHRIGQKSSVHVIDIVARDTVDLGKRQKLENKRKWITDVLDGSFNKQIEDNELFQQDATNFALAIAGF